MLQLEDLAEGVSWCCPTAINSAEAGLVILTCTAAQLRDTTQNNVMDPHISVVRTRSSPKVAKLPQRHGKRNPTSPRTQENLAVLTRLQELICVLRNSSSSALQKWNMCLGHQAMEGSWTWAHDHRDCSLMIAGWMFKSLTCNTDSNKAKIWRNLEASWFF